MLLTIIVGLLMAAVALLAVAYPILAEARSRPATSSAEDRLEELTSQRDAAFAALRDLNFDHQVGKITDEDFVVFEANLKQVAANALRALDEWEEQADDQLDLAVEEAVRARRSALNAPGVVCANCGRASAAGDLFCAGCGQPLVQPVAAQQESACVCPKCGREYEPGDQFCPACGQALGEGALAKR
jgi:hypothetical protein